MRKKLISLALAGAAFSFLPSVAQTNSGSGSSTCDGTAKHIHDCIGDRGESQGVCNPFAGLNLSEEQQAQLEALIAEYRAEREAARDEHRQDKDTCDGTNKDLCEAEREAAREKFLEQVKAILTPEQYELFVVHCGGKKGSNDQHGHNVSDDGKGHHGQQGGQGQNNGDCTGNGQGQQGGQGQNNGDCTGNGQGQQGGRGQNNGDCTGNGQGQQGGQGQNNGDCTGNGQGQQGGQGPNNGDCPNNGQQDPSDENGLTMGVDSSVTGISEVTADNSRAKVIYDLRGRRLSAITAPGLYIINGVKTIVR